MNNLNRYTELEYWQAILNERKIALAYIPFGDNNRIIMEGRIKEAEEKIIQIQRDYEVEHI